MIAKACAPCDLIFLRPGSVFAGRWGITGNKISNGEDGHAAKVLEDGHANGGLEGRVGRVQANHHGGKEPHRPAGERHKCLIVRVAGLNTDRKAALGEAISPARSGVQQGQPKK